MSNSKTNILIVDDQPANLHLLREILAKEGYQVRPAKEGAHALKAAKAQIPDLILLDIEMPEMNGFEVCQELKKDPGLTEIPVIFVSAKYDIEDKTYAFSLGAVDYITKPFQPKEVLARVKTHLSIKTLREKLKKQNLELTKEVQERKKAEKTLEERNAEQKQMLHILCHDLANPFVNIISILNLCEEDPAFFENVKDNLKISTQNGLDLIALVRELRAIEEGKIKIDLKSHSLYELITESLNILSKKIEDKKIKIQVSANKSITVMVERVSFVNSVLNNLITNAVKFSDVGSSIQIQAEEKKDNILLKVIDQGIGIPEELLKNIFDMTKTTNRKGTEGETGTGFGMPLIKKFIEIYGGEIEIDSQPQTIESGNQGTTVSLLLKKGE